MRGLSREPRSACPRPIFMTSLPVARPLVAGAVLISLAGCGYKAPDAFTSRVPLPSCGTYDIGHDDTPDAAATCFADAVGGSEGAEYAVTRATDEGDPIVTYYRTLPGDSTVDVFIDSTRDDFGTKGWTRQTCTGYDLAMREATGCGPGQTDIG